MKERENWWKAIAGLAVVAVLAVGLGLLLRGQLPTPVATEPTAMATTQPTATQEATTTPTTVMVPTGTALTSPTPVTVVAPTEAALPEPTTSLPGLDDYVFSKPQVVLTYTLGGTKLIDWLPDSRRLLLELKTGDPVLHNRIVTLDVETGEIVEYGRRPDIDIKPVWVEKYQGVAYSFLKLTEASELRFGRPGGQTIILDTDYFPVTVDPKTGRIFYQKLIPGTPLRAIDPSENAMSIIPFDTISLPMGIPLIDPTGKHLAVLGRNELPVLDLEQEQVYIYDFGALSQEPGLFWWAEDGAWNSTGQTLALRLTATEDSMSMYYVEDRLAILDVTTGELRAFGLPSRWLDEIDWVPDGHHLLVKASYESDPNEEDPEKADQPNLFWFVDTPTENYQAFDLFAVDYPTSGQFFMAWSPDGKRLAWLHRTSGGGGVFMSEVRSGH